MSGVKARNIYERRKRVWKWKNHWSAVSGKNPIMWCGISMNELAELLPCATERLHRISLYVEERLIYGCSSDKTEISDGKSRSSDRLSIVQNRVEKYWGLPGHINTLTTWPILWIERERETERKNGFFLNLDYQIVADETVEFLRKFFKISLNPVL